jgi:hypothetical protein
MTHDGTMTRELLSFHSRRAPNLLSARLRRAYVSAVDSLPGVGPVFV